MEFLVQYFFYVKLHPEKLRETWKYRLYDEVLVLWEETRSKEDLELEVTLKNFDLHKLPMDTIAETRFRPNVITRISRIAFERMEGEIDRPEPPEDGGPLFENEGDMIRYLLKRLP